jgi:hypothetical protein
MATAPAGAAGFEAERVVEATSSLLITVLDAEGRSLPGIDVSLRSEGGAGQSAVTDMAGEAFFGPLGAGSYSYLVESPDRPSLASAAPIQLERGQQRSLSLRLVDYSRSISGRVLSPNGVPIAGIDVVAKPARLPDGAEMLRLAEVGDPKDQSSEDGSYALRDLADGEYAIRSVETERYAAVEIVAHAGVDSADIVLVERQGARLYGTVRTESGAPLAGARVISPTEESRSQEDGSYEVWMTLGDRKKTYAFRFLADGYRERSVAFGGAELEKIGGKHFDIRLEPEPDVVAVAGALRGEYGEAVSGERVRISSPTLKTHYYATSDADGHFSFANVAVSSDYEVWVQPVNGYRDHIGKSIQITRDNVFLDIVLLRLETGRLTGQIVDSQGNPVPRFGLWLSSAEAPKHRILVSGDEGGFFVVEEAPAGQILLESRSNPKIQIGAITLPPAGEKDVRLVVNRGNEAMRGRVLDDRGSPIPGAFISVSFSDQSDGISSISHHQAVTDVTGVFRFTQLGAGRHKVRIQAEGYKGVEEFYAVGSEDGNLEVTLHRSSR